MTAMIQKFFSMLLSLILAITGLSSLSDISPMADNGEVLSSRGFSSVTSESCEIKSEKEVTINNLVLNELGDKIKGFKLEAKLNGEYVLVTAGDTVGAYRYCKFNDVTSDTFRITVTDYSSSFAVTGVSLGYTKTENPDFKVASYIRASFLGDNYRPDPGRFETTTDLIVIEACTFDETGTLSFRYMDKVQRLMAEVREINPDIRIHLNILGTLKQSGSTWEETIKLLENLNLSAMGTNREYFIDNIVSALETYGFDGVDFDWEYPDSLRAKYGFSDFVIALDEALGDKYLGAAISSWYDAFTRKAMKVLDSVEVMCYDEFDDNGYHSTFSSAYSNVKRLLLKGYRKDQINVGLAFYARPTDAGAYWIGYGEYAEKLGKYGNVADGTYDGREMTLYFNGVQLITDKTAYALDSGLGGVMIWHLDCDTDYSNDLSLYRAIHDTINF